jgi:hypothetical protein
MTGVDHDDAFVMLVGASGQGQTHADQERYNPPHHHSAAIQGDLRLDDKPGLDPVVDVHVVGGPTVSLVQNASAGYHLLVRQEGASDPVGLTGHHLASHG